MSENEDVSIDLLLLDVLRGYSKIEYKGHTYYLKHFSVFGQLNLSEFESEAFKSALKKGIKSKNDLLNEAKKRGYWSDQDESDIKNLKWLISKSEEALVKISDYNVRKSMKENIQKDIDKLNEIQGKRESITSHCAENLALRKRNSRTVLQNIFKDEKMTQKIDEDDLFEFSHIISAKIDLFSNIENLLKMAYSPSFFDLYSLMYRDPLKIFNKDIYNITQWQKSLLFFASVIFNKLKNLDMPDDVKEDPLKIYKFKPSEKQEESDSVVHGVEDLRQKMAKNGGKLTAKDF